MSNPDVNAVSQENSNVKELNFRALEAKLAQEKAARLEAEKARLEAERKVEEALSRRYQEDEDEDQEDDPYVDHKRLDKKLAKFGEKTMQKTQHEIKSAVAEALREEKKQNFIKNNPDFYDILEKSPQWADENKDLAETILEMPQGFERQKLVYQAIKKLDTYKQKAKESSIQEKVDTNRRTPYYQPSGMGAPGYSQGGDFSQGGQKNAYEKMMQLKQNLRMR